MFADGTVKDGDYSYTQMLGTSSSVASEIYGKIVSQKDVKIGGMWHVRAYDCRF